MWTVVLSVEIKVLFRDRLVRTEGLSVEIKLLFRDRLVWTVHLTVEIKLRTRDGLVWTVGQTVEIKLRFQFFQRSVDRAVVKIWLTKHCILNTWILTLTLEVCPAK